MNYYNFMKKYWKEPIEGDIQYICDDFQMSVERIGLGLRGRELVAKMPPRSGKSHIFSIMSVPWAWTKYPHLKFLMATYDRRLAEKFAHEAKLIMDSPEYKEQFGDILDEGNSLASLTNKYGGERHAIGKEITSRGVDMVICDDLTLQQDAVGRAQDWFDMVARTRSTRGALWLIDEQIQIG